MNVSGKNEGCSMFTLEGERSEKVWGAVLVTAQFVVTRTTASRVHLICYLLEQAESCGE